MTRIHHTSLLLGLLLLLGTIAVFHPVLTHDFVAWDDDVHVYANPRLQPVTWANVRAFWAAPYEHLYIPLTYTVWAGLAWLSHLWAGPQEGPLDAALFHRLNLLLHLGSAFLVWRIAICLWEPRGTPDTASGLRLRLTAGAAALLFAVHPLQVEAVAWVSGLKDVLCGCVALLALWQYLLALHSRTAARWYWHYGLATGAFCLALLAKPAATVVPVMAWILARRYHRKSWQAGLWPLVPWILTAVLWGLWTKEQQPDGVMSFITPLWLRPIIATDTLAFYLTKLVWPVQLSPDYGRTPQLVLSLGWRVMPALLCMGMMLAVLWRKHRQLPGIILGLEVFVAGLLPVLGWVPFLFQVHSTVADRYVYLAMLGPALGLAWLLQYRGPGRVWWGLVALGLMLLGWQGARQVRVWQDTVTLFTHALQVNPRSAMAHNNLGLALANQGQFEAAIAHYRQALCLRPDYVYTHNNLGLALANQGQLEAAIAHYTTALQLQPSYATAHSNLGLTLIRRGQFKEAITHFSQALAILPNDPKVLNHLGIAFAAQGKFAEATEQFIRAIQQQPTSAKAYHNLGLALSRQGRLAEAIVALRTARHVAPTWPQAASSLAQVLVLQHPLSQPVLAEAITLAEQACSATAYREANPLHTLALVYQAAGDTARASMSARQALQLAHTAGDTALAGQLAAQFPETVQPEAAHD